MISINRLKRWELYFRVLACLVPEGKKRHVFIKKKCRVRELIKKIKSRKAVELDCRTRVILESPDLSRITTCPNAGEIIGNDQIMHNGVKVAVGSYYTEYLHRVQLKETRSIHEPQEEYVFQEVLKHIKPGSTMMELGSFWAFYSLWFKSQVPDAQCIMVEPEMQNLNNGRLNFSLNGYEGTFNHGFIGQKWWLNPSDIPTYSVDGLVEKHNLEHIHLLHSDIQGAEFEMLQGARKTISAGKIDYIFVSTHSPLLQEDCRKFLIDNDFDIIAEHTLAESYSLDGLLVGRRKELQGLGLVEISKRNH